MENFVGINNNLLVRWRLLKNDGKPFAVDTYICKVTVFTGRGRVDVQNFSITGTDRNIISWEMNIPDFRFLGNGSVVVNIFRKGRQVARAEQRDAFRVFAKDVRHCDCVQTLDVTSFVNILHPEETIDKVNVMFPSFEVDEHMHLHLKGDTELYYSDFTLGSDGHLYFHYDD